MQAAKNWCDGERWKNLEFWGDLNMGLVVCGLLVIWCDSFTRIESVSWCVYWNLWKVLESADGAGAGLASNDGSLCVMHDMMPESDISHIWVHLASFSSVNWKKNTVSEFW
jgi:hypothetical protein